MGTHLDGDLLTEMRGGRPHPRLGVVIPRSGLVIADDTELSASVADADLVVLGVNSQGIEWALEVLGRTLRQPVPLLLLTKGLFADGERLAILPDYVRRELSRSRHGDIPVMAIGGPSIARELAEYRDTSIVLAGTDADLCRSTADRIRGDHYHIQTSADTVGVEVAAAFKNLYAIAVGLCEGSSEIRAERNHGALGFNPAASVFAQAIREIAYLAELLGGTAASVYGLAGVGDLYVTSRRGRNNRAGKLMASGTSWAELRRSTMRDDTIEGAELAIAIAPTIMHLIECGRIDHARIPLLQVVIDVVVHGKPPAIPWSRFLEY